MKNFLITLCFGWLGVHRFMQKKYGTGILWLLTFGMFGIGWAVDTVIALVNISKAENKTEQIFGGGSPIC